MVLGTDCHFTAIQMGKITSGPIQSISSGRTRFDQLSVKVVFPNQPLPSLIWSNYTGPGDSCKDHISTFPGIDSTPRTEEWPLDLKGYDKGFDPGPAKGPLTAIPQVVSTQSFQVRILPAWSPSCPR